MDRRNQFTTNPTYMPPQHQLQFDRLRRSPWLTAFGVLELFPSLILMGWSIWIVTSDLLIQAGCAGIVCGAVHLFVGILAIIGGRRGVIQACLIMAIISSCVFAPATVIVVFVNWRDYNNICKICEFFRNTGTCFVECIDVDPKLIFITVLVLSLLAAVVAVVISSISCYNMQYCCGSCCADNTPQSFQIAYRPVATYSEKQLCPPGYIDGVKYDGKTFTNIPVRR